MRQRTWNHTLQLSLLGFAGLCSATAIADFGPQPPDQVDVLFNPALRPRIQLVLDYSGSMNDGAGQTQCPWYQTTYGISASKMNRKINSLRATLVGCKAPDDGFLDKWHDKADISIRTFHGNHNLLVPWNAPTNASLASMESAVVSAGTSGGTEITRALSYSANDFNSYWNNANSLQCRPNIILLMSDGAPTSGGVNLNYACTPPGPAGSFSASGGEPWCTSAYISGNAGPSECDGGWSTGHPDMLCGQTGNQDIKVFSVGFAPSSSAWSKLQKTAAYGNGLAFLAANQSALDEAMEEIMYSVQSTPNIVFTTPAFAADGVFSGNDAFLSNFKPSSKGLWVGNVKQACLFPSKDANGNYKATGTDATCYYIRDPANFKELVINPNPTDKLTGSTVTDADAGGFGKLLQSAYHSAVGSISSIANYPRKLYTWKLSNAWQTVAGGSCGNNLCELGETATGCPGDCGLIRVNPGSLASLPPSEVWVHGIERVAILNRLNGFDKEVNLGDSDVLNGLDDDVTGLDPDDWKPVGALKSWPLAESMNSPTMVLNYTTTPKTIVLYPSNDGMIHALDADSASGTYKREISALMPGELLKPRPEVHDSVRDAFDPIDEKNRHAYLLDGAMRLYHEDINGNGKIDRGLAGERAFLFFGLGRNGGVYYLADITGFNGNFAAGAGIKVYPIRRTAGTNFEDLGDTWNPPWVGKMWVGAIASQTEKRVAIFGSGHDREWDYPDALIPDEIPGDWLVQPGPNVPCASLSVTTSTTMFTSTASIGVDYCNFVYPGCANPWGCGYPDDPAGINEVVGPFTLPSNPNAVAYRVNFSTFDLSNTDRIELRSDNGRTSQILSGNLGSGFQSNWIYGKRITLGLVSDGVLNPANTGFAIDSVDYLEAVREAPRRKKPSIFVVDVDEWKAGAAIPAFADRYPTTPKTLDDDVLLYRFTSDCADKNGNTHGTNCIDQNTSAATAELRYMTCAISAEVSALTVEGVLDRAYVGDECGQIWRLARDPSSGDWAVNRIFRSNEGDSGWTLPANWPDTTFSADVPNAHAKNVRKIMRKMDLVRTRCNSTNAVGIYFGTGNAQRPTAKDEHLTRSDIIGVLWDDGTLPTGASAATLTSFVNATGSNSVASSNFSPPSSKKGWYIKLGAHERMLRDPAVFAKVAYFKTYRPPTGTVNECTPGLGEDLLYAMDSCSSEAFNTDSNGDSVHDKDDRLVSVTMGTIGASPAIIATRKDVVVIGDKGTIAKDPIRPKPDFSRPRLLNWRPSK